MKENIDIKVYTSLVNDIITKAYEIFEDAKSIPNMKEIREIAYYEELVWWILLTLKY